MNLAKHIFFWAVMTALEAYTEFDVQEPRRDPVEARNHLLPQGVLMLSG